MQVTTRSKAQLALLAAIAVGFAACVSARVERDGGRADAYEEHDRVLVRLR